MEKLQAPFFVVESISEGASHGCGEVVSPGLGPRRSWVRQLGAKLNDSQLRIGE